MKKFYLMSVMALAALAGVMGCAEDEGPSGPVAVTEIQLDKQSVEIVMGETAQLSAIVLPEDATDKTVLWTTSDREVATVDDNGMITAVAKGRASVTATSGKATAVCDVTVVGIPVESVVLDITDADILKGDSVRLTATVMPEDAEDTSCTWTSSDELIATVSENGMVYGLALGEAVITVQAGNCEATCNVTVSPVPVESVTLDCTECELIVGETVTLVAVVLPENAEDRTVTWSSSLPSVAAVDEDGLVTALAAGSAVVTAAAGDKKAECTVTVVESREPAIGDYYFSDGTVSGSLEDGRTPIGVIFRIFGNGDSAKIVSLDEALLPYSDMAGTSYALDEYDGAENQSTIMNLPPDMSSDWRSQYPAFRWCADREEGGLNWYLPAKMELKQIYAAANGLVWVESDADESKGEIDDWGDNTTMPGYDSGECSAAKASFSMKCSDVGGSPLSDGRYFSSTGKSYKLQAESVNFTNGMCAGFSKITESPVRAIAKVKLN